MSFKSNYKCKFSQWKADIIWLITKIVILYNTKYDSTTHLYSTKFGLWNQFDMKVWNTEISSSHHGAYFQYKQTNVNDFDHCVLMIISV